MSGLGKVPDKLQLIKWQIYQFDPFLSPSYDGNIVIIKPRPFTTTYDIHNL